MANPAPKIINYNFSYLIVSVRGPSQTCASLSVSVSVSLDEIRQDTRTSIWSRSFLRPQAGLVHMPGNSLTTYCEMLTTHQLLSETLGPPSKVSSTVPPPNNNLRQPLRDFWGPLSHIVSFVHTVLTNACTDSPGTQTAFSVPSLLQLCHVALLRHHLVRRWWAQHWQQFPPFVCGRWHYAHFARRLDWGWCPTHSPWLQIRPGHMHDFAASFSYTWSWATSSRPWAFLILTPGLTKALRFSR